MTRQQADRAQLFHSLHRQGTPLVLYNVWDAGSAKAVAEAGAAALATGSWSVAAAHGFADGETLPLPLALANLQRIVGAVGLPVSVDLESGYGAAPDAVADTLAAAVEAGAVGCNLEDRIAGEPRMLPAAAQASRIAAARAVADRLGLPFFLNARTDVFLLAEPATHSSAHVEDALARAERYAAAGASGIFVPGLVDARLIGKLCEQSPLPVNVMFRPGLPPYAELAALGVRRISYAGHPYRVAMQALTEAAKAAFGK